MGAGAAAAVVGVVAGTRVLGYDDDVLRALGARPRPIPDERDTTLLEAAAIEQAQLAADLEALAGRHEELDVTPLTAIAEDQLAALGGAPRPTGTAPTDDQSEAARTAADAWLAASERRRDDVALATSPALVTVLASLSASQRVVSEALGGRA